MIKIHFNCQRLDLAPTITPLLLSAKYESGILFVERTVPRSFIIGYRAPLSTIRLHLHAMWTTQTNTSSPTLGTSMTMASQHFIHSGRRYPLALYSALESGSRQSCILIYTVFNYEGTPPTSSNTYGSPSTARQILSPLILI